MSAYCHKREFQLRYTDFDFMDRFKPSSLLAMAQEAACSSADELGFGYEALKSKGMAFIIVHTICEMGVPVRIGDKLTASTWPLPPRHVIFERDTLFENQKGEAAAKIASRWCLVDLKTFSLLMPDRLGEAHEQCPYNPKKLLPAVTWKIPKLDDEARNFCYETTVGTSRLDHYFHANNTVYADLFLDCFRSEELNRPFDQFQIAYINQAKEGVKLSFFRKEEGESTICEAWDGGELISRFQSHFSH